MRTVTALELRRRLGEILDAAAAGERIYIERDHRPLAVLVSVEEGRRLEESPEERRERALTALGHLDEFVVRMQRKHPPHPGEPTAAEAVREDRDRDLSPEQEDRGER